MRAATAPFTQDLYSGCTDFSERQRRRRPKIAEVPTLSRFSGLERAKGIEPSYAAWEAGHSPPQTEHATAVDNWSPADSLEALATNP
jgi:hypothetical protein